MFALAAMAAAVAVDWPAAWPLPRTSALREIEENLTSTSRLLGALRPLAGHLPVGAVLADGKVLRGRDGWLFYRPGVAAAVARPAAQPDPVPAVVDFRAQLAARGVDMILVLVPNKESVYPEMLGARQGGNRVTERTLAALRAEGVEVIDLRGPLLAAKPAAPRPLYLAQDTHWSPDGVAVAARVLAGHLAGRLPTGTRDFPTEPVHVDWHGDLARMLGASTTVPEPLETQQVAGCVSDAAPLLLIGDSFLRVFQADRPGNAGLAAQLARHLHQPVAQLAIDGGGATLVRQELARRPELLAGKKLVVWEVVERDFSLELDQWPIVPLGPPAR